MVNPPLPNHFAIVAPEVYITDLSLPKLSFNLGEEIKVGDEATAMLEIQSDGSRLARTVTVFVE